MNRFKTILISSTVAGLLLVVSATIAVRKSTGASPAGSSNGQAPAPTRELAVKEPPLAATPLSLEDIRTLVLSMDPAAQETTRTMHGKAAVRFTFLMKTASDTFHTEFDYVDGKLLMRCDLRYPIDDDFTKLPEEVKSQLSGAHRFRLYHSHDRGIVLQRQHTIDLRSTPEQCRGAVDDLKHAVENTRSVWASVR